MKNTSRILAAAMFALALPLGLSAQTPPPAAPAAPAKIELGKWSGTVSPPGQGAIGLVFDVTAAGDTVKAELTIPDASMTFAVSGIKLEGTKLSFTFLAGPTDVKCTLEKKESGSYEGPCVDGSGEGGAMTLTPPKKGTPGEPAKAETFARR